MPTVFPVQPWYTLTHGLQHINHIADFGDGFEQRINKNVTHTRADGEGGVTSYKGRNTFSVRLRKQQHVNADSTKSANKLWNFYKAETGSLRAFYFYNPAELPILDTTGLNATGRYLVRFKNNSLSRDQFVQQLFNVGLELIEVRD